MKIINLFRLLGICLYACGFYYLGFKNLVFYAFWTGIILLLLFNFFKFILTDESYNEVLDRLNIEFKKSINDLLLTFIMVLSIIHLFI